MRTDSHIKTVAHCEWYTEGPVVDEDGNLFCTTLVGGKILKISPSGQISNWAKSIWPNGQLIVAGGDHLVCDSKLSTVIRFDKNGLVIRNEISGHCDGEPINAPNDLVADKDGGIYFTDSVRYIGKVCYFSPGGQQSIVATNIDYPNGIALSPNEEYLYVAESFRNRILVMKLKMPGVADRKPVVFAELPSHPSGKPERNLPDGIKTSKNGNLWIAHHGMKAIQVYSIEGKQIDCIETLFELTSNIYIGEEHIIISGGHSEPGPGGLLKINYDDLFNNKKS